MYVVAFRYGDLAAVMHKIADLLLGRDARSRADRAMRRLNGGPPTGPHSWNCCGPVADRDGPPSAPPVLGSRQAPGLSLWQLTTRPPRSGRSGSQLPVETGFEILVRGGADGGAV